jgi:hypothetical protein
MPAKRAMLDEADQSEYREIVRGLRSLYSMLSPRGMDLSILAFKQSDLRHFKAFRQLGGGLLPVKDDFHLQGASVVRVVFMHDAESPYQLDLAALLSKAGTLLPNRVRELLGDDDFKTAIAWWLGALWRFSKIRPDDEYVDVGDRCVDFVGWRWSDPIAASLSVIEAARLVVPKPEETAALAGDWSAPMSKIEFARRVLQNRNARPRDVKALFNRLETRQVEGASKWSIRLDTLDESLRKKLMVGEP